jgi:allantoin racemase
VAADAGCATRVLIINPNNSESITRRLRTEARRVFGAVVGVDAVTAAKGPRYVETQADEVVAGAAVLDIVQRLENPSFREAQDGDASNAVVETLPDSATVYDAYAIGCFSDPALAAVREVTAKPVVGFGEATLLLAHGLGVDFALICNVDSDVPGLRELAERYGLAKRLAAIRPVGFSIAAFDNDDPRAAEALRRAARQVVKENHVGALCLGCAVFADFRQALSEELDVTVLDGMISAVELASFCVRMRPNRRA